MTCLSRKSLIAWLPAVAFWLAAQACALSPGSVPPPAATPAQDSWYTVYFTTPHDPQADTRRGGPDATLAEAIDGAHASVDVAIYELNLYSIRDALLRAHQRGVTVRMVMESSRMDSDEVQELIAAGIPVVGDHNPGLMHNKFTVIDQSEVWTGSMNLTVTDAYRNNNNLLHLRSESLAENYRVEFEEMFTSARFGEASPANTPRPIFTIDGTPVQVCFAPEDRCLGLILEQVRNAESSIDFLAFSLTSDVLADAILAAAERGVQVRGVMETDQVSSNTGGDYDRLVSSGLDVRLDGNPRNMHHKVLLVDQRLVITGSYNFSRSAETRNDENLLVIENYALAGIYMQEFELIYAQAKSGLDQIP